MSHKSKLNVAIAIVVLTTAIGVLGLSSQAFAKGQPTPFHLNSYYQQAMAVTTQAFAAGGSSGVGLSQVGGGFHSPVFAPPETRETPVSPASPGSVFGNG